MIPIDHRFAFDALGYLHLPGVLSPQDLAETWGWMAEAEKMDLAVLNNEMNEEEMNNHLDRPVSRVIDADPRFAKFLDHPVTLPYLEEFLGDYRHIDNDMYYTHPGYKGGGWHRGVASRPKGNFKDGKFITPMVKVFFCVSDVGQDQGEFVVVPGSHRTEVDIDLKRVDLPAQHIFSAIKAGDVIIFDEGLLHNGRPNPSDHTRKTLIFNFGRSDIGVWKGYKPKPETLAKVTERQRRILSNGDKVWKAEA